MRGNEERNPPGELKDRGEIRERYAQRDVGADVLPGGGEVAGDQAQKAEKDGGSAVDVKPEIRRYAALFCHRGPGEYKHLSASCSGQYPLCAIWAGPVLIGWIPGFHSGGIWWTRNFVNS